MDNQLLTYLIISLFGVIFIVIGLSKRKQRTQFLQDGVKADGIVFRVETRYDGDKGGVSYYPVVRFVTQEKEWITREYDIGTGLLNAYKEGDKVNVIYNRTDNTKFILNDTTTKLTGPIFIIIGIALITGLWICYFFHIQLTH